MFIYWEEVKYTHYIFKIICRKQALNVLIKNSTKNNKTTNINTNNNTEQQKRHQWIYYSFPANFWVGGEDDLIEGEWTWAETDEPFDFTDWVPTQPDNSQGEDCLVLWQAASWEWNDLSCNTHSYYICEKS